MLAQFQCLYTCCSHCILCSIYSAKNGKVTHCKSVASWTRPFLLFRSTMKNRVTRLYLTARLVQFFWRSRTVESRWNVMAHGDVREGKWKGNWRMQWVASTLRTTSEHGVSSITTSDAHKLAASSRLNWRPPADLNGLVRFERKTKSGSCACAITFQLVST